MGLRSKREVAPPPSSSPPPPPLLPTQPAAAGSGTTCAGFEATSFASLQAVGGAMALPPGNHQSAWWNLPRPQAINPFSHVFPDNGMDLRPPGGFVNFLQTGQHPFVPPHVSFPPPWSHAPPAPATDSCTQHAKSRSKAKSVSNIDDSDDVRTAKRLTWAPEEDLRLVSAWLYHSNDPVNGNGKKNDSYWGDVVELYNSTTPINRKREVKHLKDRWQRIKKWVGFLCACWKKATSIYTSGYSDDQWRDMADKFYVEDYPKEGPFTVFHCWKVLRHEPKWHAVLAEVQNPKKRGLDDGGDSSSNTLTQEDIGEKERPMGRNEAKKQRYGKGKGKGSGDDDNLHEDMKKYMDIQATASKRHEEFLETQKHISDAKVKAASLRREAVLTDTYQKMMSMDTSQMTDEMKAEHVMGLKMLRDKLLGNTI